MNFILDKTYINKDIDLPFLTVVVEKEHGLLKEKINGSLLYYEFNVLSTGEIESIEFAIDNSDNKTFIKGFELQDILKSHIEPV